ncbi:MAG: SprT family zinc-dependent metalloprotease [Acidaminobacteraceae bacterium]
MKLIIEDREINYFIEYRKRKSVEIRIEPSGMVRVRAPKGSDESKVLELLESKSKWIIEHMDKYFEAKEKKPESDYESGDMYRVLWKTYELKLVINSEIFKSVAKIDKDHIVVESNTDEREVIAKAIDTLYRQEARKIIKARVKIYQSHFKSKPKEITFKNEKSRWGSCTSDRVINFNYRIIMAPLNIVDYLVVHEMCHLAHMNHSKSFWTMVGGILPDYKESREWLKYNGFTLKL